MIVGSVGDLHIPFTHPGYFAFICDTWEKYDVGKTNFVGDITDNHGISFHEKDPDGMSAGHEADAAEKDIKTWHKRFEDSFVEIGNHDALIFRQAKACGLPGRLIKSYADVWNTPTWKWVTSHVIDGVHYTHGTGNSGKSAALNLAIQKRCSVVIGHIHSWGGVQYHTNHRDRIFGMNCGCGIDCEAYAFAYARDFVTRPTLGCGIVRHGDEAFFVPMPCGTGEKYNRRRFKKRRKVKVFA